MWLAVGIVAVTIAVGVCLRVLCAAFDEEATQRPKTIRVRSR
jgi:hypothetical protein